MARGAPRRLSLVVRGLLDSTHAGAGVAGADPPRPACRAASGDGTVQDVMTESTRVLHLLVTTSQGGGPKHVFDLVRHLPRDEFEVVVAAPRDGVFFDRFRDLGVTVIELPLSRLDVRHLSLTMGLLRRQGIGVVHTHGKGPGLYGRLAARACRIPAVHTFHGIHYGGYPKLGQWLYFELERRLSRLTHAVINVSRSQEAEGLALRLFRADQSVVVVNGVDVEELDRAIGRSPIRREMLGVAPHDFVLGCVSR